MKFQYFSDLHTECHHHELRRAINVDKLIKKEEGIVIFAGDIMVFNEERNPSRMFGPLTTAGVDLFYIPGNHEFYRSNARFMFDTIKFHTRVVEREDFIVILSPLWSHLREGVKERVEQSIADFYRIEGHSGDFHNEIHAYCKEFVRHHLARYINDPRKKIVVSHFSPTQHSIAPYWRMHGGVVNEYFSNSMTDMIEEFQPDVWVHGHTHDTFDYMIGKTRILCNPRGYPEEKKPGEFHYNVVEI